MRRPSAQVTCNYTKRAAPIRLCACFQLSDFPCAWFRPWMISFILKICTSRTFYCGPQSQCTVAAVGMRNKYILCIAIEIRQRFPVIQRPLNSGDNKNEAGKKYCSPKMDYDAMRVTGDSPLNCGEPIFSVHAPRTSFQMQKPSKHEFETFW